MRVTAKILIKYKGLLLFLFVSFLLKASFVNVRIQMWITSICLFIDNIPSYATCFCCIFCYHNILFFLGFLRQGSLMDMFENFVENQDKTNFVLTVFFILLPTALLSTWSLYIHVTQPDIIPLFKNLPYIMRVLVRTLNIEKRLSKN